MKTLVALVVSAVVLAAALALIVAPPAQAITLTGDSTPRMQRVVDRLRLPTPDETVEIVTGDCPLTTPGDRPADCTRSDLNTIYLRPGPGMYLRLVHEIGHRVEYTLTDAERAAFQSLTGDTRAWRCGCANSPHEQAAEAWARLARFARPASAAYGADAYVTTHRRAVRALFRQAAQS